MSGRVSSRPVSGSLSSSSSSSSSSSAAPTRQPEDEERGWSFSSASSSPQYTGGALFCPACHSLLDLPDARLVVRCLSCDYSANFTAGDRRLERVSVSTRYNNRRFLPASSSASASSSSSARASSRRAMVNESCPKCKHPQLYFYTMQLRSVDEGQTVFYECGNCDHKFSTDN